MLKVCRSFLGEFKEGIYLICADEIAHHLKDSNAQMVVVYSPLIPAVQKALEMNKRTLPMLAIGPRSGDCPHVEDVIQDGNLGYADPATVSDQNTL